MDSLRRRLALALVAVLWGCTGETSPELDALEAALSSLIEQEIEARGIPGFAIALVDGRASEEVIWAEGFGIADPTQGTPATAETVWRVGSVSKMFTDLAVMQQVEAGVIDIDAPITDILPEFQPENPFAEPITLRQLMCHRAGLVREPPVGNYFASDEASLADTVRSLHATTLVFPPGERIKYSNGGIAVVGRALEVATGRPFAEVLRSDLLDPLGMAHSDFEPSERVASPRARGTMWTLDGRTFDAPRFELGEAPAGSLYTTPSDLGSFLAALFEGGAGVIAPESLEEAFRPQFAPDDATEGYGLGFRVRQIDGRRTLGHGGAIYGFSTQLLFLPDEQLGVVAVSNLDVTNDVVGRVAQLALEALLAVREGRNLPAFPTPPEAVAASWAPRTSGPPPAAPPEDWLGLIGEYGPDHMPLYVLEREGQLHALIEWTELNPLTEIDRDTFAFPTEPGYMYFHERLHFERGPDDRATAVIAAGIRFERRDVGLDEHSFAITPLRPIAELRDEAIAAQPPPETGTFLEPEPVDLASLDDTIRFDVRYAGTDNFLRTPLYRTPRAFLQRPAAEALLRAHLRLAEHGYGLLIHDAYRPWWVTKVFWEATPDELRDFVADPSQGSRHNRGCAVDLTLYDLETGETVEMVGGYDEMSPRSYPEYPGGTGRQRYFRDLLRSAMEAEGFEVYEWEWWHFDFHDWRRYPISNLTFEAIDAGVVVDKNAIAQ